MNISITPELEQFVHAKVKSGMYNSASELIREALRLLVERDELHARRIAAMDQFLQEGLDSAANEPPVTPEELEAELDQLFAEMESQHG